MAAVPRRSRRRPAAAGAVLAAVGAALLGGCTGPAADADAATVHLAVTGDHARGIDSPLACVVRVQPGTGQSRAGAVSDCTAPLESPPALALRLAPGAYQLQVLRAACPGMPGRCAQDAYDATYNTEGALWSCSVAVQVSARQQRTVTAEVTDPGSATCTV